MDREGADKLEVERPDAVVLGNGQGLQCAIKEVTDTTDLTLFHHELGVVQPDTRHLVNGTKRGIYYSLNS